METADSLETTLDRDGYIILQETLNEQKLSEFRDSIRQVFALAARMRMRIFSKHALGWTRKLKNAFI